MTLPQSERVVFKCVHSFPEGTSHITETDFLFQKSHFLSYIAANSSQYSHLMFKQRDLSVSTLEENRTELGLLGNAYN